MRIGVPFGDLPAVDGGAIRRLRAAGPGPVGDVLGQQGVGGTTMPAAMRPVHCAGNFAGQAVTLKQIPSRGRPGVTNHHIDILYEAAPGQVVVIDGAGQHDLIVMGGRGALLARNRGLEAMIVGAAVRDVEELREIGVPVFASAVRVTSPRVGAVLETEAVNVTVCVHGVRVDPGDVVVGGEDGMVVVPHGLAAEVAERAEELDRGDKEQLEKIRAGLPKEEWYR